MKKCERCGQHIHQSKVDSYDDESNLKTIIYERGHLKDCPDWNKVITNE